MEEANKYRELGLKSAAEYDSLNCFLGMDVRMRAAELEKIVFGYHPFWGGSNYLNYQWDLLSDLSYFSYEVDPYSGHAATYHDWLTSPAIDSAFANGTRVHLCVTLFSGHSSFFNNSTSKLNLTNNLIELVKQRGAQGVSFDFEAVPSSQGQNMIDYIADFSAIFRDSLPDGILSIAMPAVDWSGIFDVQELNQYIDLYMIMGYDYYWNSSSMAGPIDPHYSMTSGYDYNVSRTISYYQTEGMPLDRMLIGVSYYAREWPTASGTAPSYTTGNGTAYTWAKIKNNNSGHYSTANKHFEPNSFSPYFSYENNGWYQCFVNDTRSLERRYKMVNNRGLAGIGIWALGYDNGHTDLWETISGSFSQGTPITWFDTIYDSGGPSWYYYNNEDYVMTFHGEPTEALRLEFSDFNLENGYDSLWVYDGSYPGGMLLGGYTGNSMPHELFSGDMMSLRFHSDGGTGGSGWIATIESFPVKILETEWQDINIQVYPNPVSSILTIKSSLNGQLRLYNMEGKILIDEQKNLFHHSMDLSQLKSGIYLLILSDGIRHLDKKILRH